MFLKEAKFSYQIVIIINEFEHWNLQRHSSLPPIYLYIHKMNFDIQYEIEHCNNMAQFINPIYLYMKFESKKTHTWSHNLRLSIVLISSRWTAPASYDVIGDIYLT